MTIRPHPKSRPRFALHPGWVTSINDGDRHFITGPMLARLYELSRHEYVIWDGPGKVGRREEDYIHLYPSREGRYGRPR